MNKMKEVTKLLGLKWLDENNCSEEFQIYDINNRCVFSSDIKNVLNTYMLDEEGLFVKIQHDKFIDNKRVGKEIDWSWQKHRELQFLLNGSFIPLKIMELNNAR